MVEIMPFGRLKGLSVEQICLKDYKYFTWILEEVDLRKRSLAERFRFIEYVVNHFVPVLPCGNSGCENSPGLISIYHNWRAGQRVSDTHFIYCSEDCFEKDPLVTLERGKITLEALRFRTAISSTKFDTNYLIGVMAKTMGMKEARKSKEYLEDFFNKVETY